MSLTPPTRFRATLLARHLALAALTVLAACGGASAGGGSGGGDTLYVAVAATRTATGAAYVRGAELAIETLNATREEGMRPVGVRLPPDEPLTQVGIAARFRDDPAVVGVVGHTGSGQTTEAAPVYGDVEHDGRDALVAVTPTATNPRVTLANEWIFRVCPTDDDAARALARYAHDSLRARRVAIIYRNDLFGRGFTRVFEPQARSMGMEIVERDPYLAGATEFDAYAGRLARRAPDAVIVAGGAPDVRDIVRAFRKAGIDPAIIGSDDVAGLASDTADAREFAGVRFASFYLPDATTREGASFARRYRARWNEEPNHRAALAYDAAMLIGRAAQAAGGDRRAIRDHLARTGGAARAHDGATGSIAFDATRGAVGKPVVVGVVRPRATAVASRSAR